MISVKGRWLLQDALDWRCDAILSGSADCQPLQSSSGGRLDSE